MDTLVLSKKEWRGCVAAQPSKSVLHRALICSAFSNEKTEVSGFSSSEDISATVNALKALGAGIKDDGRSFYVSPVSSFVSPVTIFCKESGSTLRFLLPVVGAIGLECTFSGEGKLPFRPIKDLIFCLEKNGMTFDGDRLPIKVGGKLMSGNYTINAGVSSQYISGLLIALSLLDGNSRLNTADPPVSAGYIGLTERVLSSFGAKIAKSDGLFDISGIGRFVSPGKYTVEGDYSSAACFLCAGALPGGNVTVTGLDPTSFQPDRKLLSILEKMGARVKIHDDTVNVSYGQLYPTNCSLDDCPDLLPVLAVTALAANGKSVFEKVGRLRNKESDRLAATKELICELGGKAEYDGDCFYVYPGILSGGTVSPKKDHRLVMAAALASTLCPVKIYETDAVCKSYPDFLSDLEIIRNGVNV